MKEQLSLFPPASRLSLSALSLPAQPPAGQKEPPAGQKEPPAGQKEPPAGLKEPPAGLKEPPAGSAGATAPVVETANTANTGTPPSSLRAARPIMVNPHLAAARRLARKMRQLPHHSAEETRAGLAICEQLKAFLQDEPNPNRLH